MADVVHEAGGEEVNEETEEAMHAHTIWCTTNTKDRNNNIRPGRDSDATTTYDFDQRELDSANRTLSIAALMLSSRLLSVNVSFVGSSVLRTNARRSCLTG